MRIVAGDCGVDLRGDADGLQAADAADSRFKRAAVPAEAVVGGAVGPIQADRDPDNPGLLDAIGHRLVHQGPVGGESDANPALVGA